MHKLACAARLLPALLLPALLLPAAAHEQRPWRTNPVVLAAPVDPVHGVGCYWHRHTVFCSRYCFWQPDGRRYCVRREHDARREHVPVLDVPPGGLWPMK
jgi:hypothetical protein